MLQIFAAKQENFLFDRSISFGTYEIGKSIPYDYERAMVNAVIDYFMQCVCSSEDNKK